MATCCAISAPFSMAPAVAWIIGHVVKPRNLSVFLGQGSLFFARGVQLQLSTPLSSGLQPQPSRQGCPRPASMSPRACGWHQCSPPRLHSKPAQISHCGWQNQAVRCACTRHVQGTTVSSFNRSSHLHDKSGNDPLQRHTTVSLHHLGPLAPPPIHKQQTHRLSL